ncbi:hypothetical protein [Lentzea sp. CA-135723]|uniref:hypothetical protein n=1 Tax=Lentzea sp. CA-135723 TaxID=3239950 RepID=UPI003D9178A2
MTEELLLAFAVPLASHDGEGQTWILGAVAAVVVICLAAVAIAQYRDPNRTADKEIREMLVGGGPRRSFPSGEPASEEDKGW